MKKDRRIDVEVAREGGKTWFKFAIDPRIQKIYETMPHEKRDSQAWPGLQFYGVDTLLEDTNYQALLGRYDFKDSYGSALVMHNTLNVAFLRTVGGKGKIELTGPVSFAWLQGQLRSLVSFCKEFYAEYLQNYRIKGSLTVEV